MPRRLFSVVWSSPSPSHSRRPGLGTKDDPAQSYNPQRPEVVSAALAELGILVEARIAAPVAPIGQDGAQESHAPLSRLTGIGERVTSSGDPPLLDTEAPHCVHDADSQQMLAGPLGVVRMVRAIATRGLGSGKERVQLMHLSLDCSLFTKALEGGSKVYVAS